MIQTVMLELAHIFHFIGERYYVFRSLFLTLHFVCHFSLCWTQNLYLMTFYVDSKRGWYLSSMIFLAKH